jgi:hypothetical protein
MAPWCTWKAEENRDVGEGGLAPGEMRTERYLERRDRGEGMACCTKGCKGSLEPYEDLRGEGAGYVGGCNMGL